MSRQYFIALTLIGLIGFAFGAYALNSVLPLPLAKSAEGSSETGVQTWVIFGSALVAFIAILATSYHNERIQKVQNTLSALQDLRTDKDYINRARIVKEFLNGDFKSPISPEKMTELLAAKAPIDSCHACGKSERRSGEVSILEAVDFVLNQYEFIAGSARLGAADMQMINWTIRSTMLGLLTALSPYIVRVRQEKPRVWANLVWISAEFEPGEWAFHKGRLGPYPPK